MADQRRTSLRFEATGGMPRVPHALRGFVEDAARSFILRPLVIREGKGSLDVYHLVGTDGRSFPLGSAGHVRTFTVLQRSFRVHPEGISWPRASTFLYPADAPMPEVTRDSADPMLLVTTHPTSVATQLIPSAQLTYINADTRAAEAR